MRDFLSIDLLLSKEEANWEMNKYRSKGGGKVFETKKVHSIIQKERTNQAGEAQILDLLCI